MDIWVGIESLCGATTIKSALPFCGRVDGKAFGHHEFGNIDYCSIVVSFVRIEIIIVEPVDDRRLGSGYFRCGIRARDGCVLESIVCVVQFDFPARKSSVICEFLKAFCAIGLLEVKSRPSEHFLTEIVNELFLSADGCAVCQGFFNGLVGM